jgi:hypothetical protein
MKEIDKIFLGIEYPDGRLKIEGPFNKYSAQKRLGYFMEKEHLPVTLTHAENQAEATLTLIQSINLRERNKIDSLEISKEN